MNFLFTHLLPGLMAVLMSSCVLAEQVQVAVAANFIAPMKLIAADFQRHTGHQAVLSPGATGKFYSQISNGAPFDILLSADDQTAAKLEQGLQAIPGSRFVYAVGRLVLWSAQPEFVDDAGAVLTKGSFRHIAVAAPRLSPYGVAAFEAMNTLGLAAALQPKLVQGESIGQAFGFVQSGNAELGFVALSQVYENGAIRAGSGWIIPATMHRPIRQEAVLLLRGKDNKAALALLAFLKTAQAGAVIRSFGYGS